MKKLAIFCLLILVSPSLFAGSACDTHPVATAATGYAPLFAKGLEGCQDADNWTLIDGVLTNPEPKDGKNLWTQNEYENFILDLEFKLAENTNSGIFIRGADTVNWLHKAIEVQIYDSVGRKPDTHICGAIFDCLAPSANTVKEPGKWNRMTIKAADNIIIVILNNQQVLFMNLDHWPQAHRNPDGTENKFEIAYKDMARTGAIGFQDHGKKIWYRNIMIKELPVQQAPWQVLFDGSDLSNWTDENNIWTIKDGAIAFNGELDGKHKANNYIWSKEKFGDFMLDLEFKVSPKGNSGIFFRTADTDDPVQTGIEFQVTDVHGLETLTRGKGGSIYDCLAPSRNTMRPAGQWNHVTLIAKSNRIIAVLNGWKTIDMNLNDWTEAGKNPDGSENKFKTAYKDMPRAGYIGFQDHGKKVWFRNVKVKPLNGCS